MNSTNFIIQYTKNCTNVTFLENFTGCVADETMTTGSGSHTNMEIITIAILGSLGMTGLVLNIGVLAIVYQKKLINKDYRMVYYMFITIGDLMFAVHSIFLAVNIGFKSVYFFRITAVCLTFIVFVGLVSYQLSAVCICLLFIDLIWSLRTPFADNKNKKVFAKAGCISALILGLLLTFVPFLYWNDIPYELSFCSIANLYGVHWDFYQHELVTVLGIDLSLMVVVSCILLQQIYRIQLTNIKWRGEMGNIEVKGIEGEENMDESGLNQSEENRKWNGHDNPAYMVDEADTVSERTKTDENKKGNEEEKQRMKKQETIEGEDKKRNKKQETIVGEEKLRSKKMERSKSESTSILEMRRRKFLKACRTVVVFMCAYVGCSLPYFILNVLGLGCGISCTQDRPETRVIRSLVLTAMFLLPVIDPILYTQRFSVFREALRTVLRKFVDKGCGNQLLRFQRRFTRKSFTVKST